MRFIIILSLLLVMLGCKQEAKQQQEAKQAGVQELKSPTGGAPSSLPHLVSHNGVTLLSWVETHGDTLSTFKYSRLIDDTWQKAETILEGSDWFVNWADYPMIAENKGNLWSHILKKSTKGTYSYDVKMNIKPVQEADWETNLAVHTDHTPTEHGFVSVIPYEDSFFVNWLDGRNTQENEVGERGAMTLRGAVISAKGEMSQEQALDGRTCDCCQTSAAVTKNGTVVLYRNRSEDEIRDISIVRQVNGEWTKPKIIHADNWQIKGCPVNGPKVVAQENNLAVAWFTGAQQKQTVKVIFSSDGGKVFQKPVVIAQGPVIGRVDMIWLNNTEAVVSWMQLEDKQAVLKAVKVSVHGELSEPIVITTMNDSRKSGFPQMELVNDKVVFAFTDIKKETTFIRIVYVIANEF